MAGKKRKLDQSKASMPNLFDMIEEISQETLALPDYQTSTKPMSARVREVVSEALKGMDCKRWVVAGQLSERCGMEITESMLNAWTAESKENHRFPLEIVPAFCEVTGDYTLMEMMAAACGCRLVTSEEVYLLKLGKINQAKRNLQKQEQEVRRSYERMKGGRP